MMMRMVMMVMGVRVVWMQRMLPSGDAVPLVMYLMVEERAMNFACILTITGACDDSQR